MLAESMYYELSVQDEDVCTSYFVMRSESRAAITVLFVFNQQKEGKDRSRVPGVWVLELVLVLVLELELEHWPCASIVVPRMQCLWLNSSRAPYAYMIPLFISNKVLPPCHPRDVDIRAVHYLPSQEL